MQEGGRKKKKTITLSGNVTTANTPHSKTDPFHSTHSAIHPSHNKRNSTTLLQHQQKQQQLQANQTEVHPHVVTAEPLHLGGGAMTSLHSAWERDDFTHSEVNLAFRNHGHPLEMLKYDITPAGMHYLLIHFDIPVPLATPTVQPLMLTSTSDEVDKNKNKYNYNYNKQQSFLLSPTATSNSTSNSTRDEKGNKSSSTSSFSPSHVLKSIPLLLSHPTDFDAALAKFGDWSLELSGLFENPITLTLRDLFDIAGPTPVTIPVTMECAGNGRTYMQTRYWTHVPWMHEAIGTAAWTGIPLLEVVNRAGGLKKDALELLFTGADKGLQGGEVQYYQRCLSLEDALRPEVLLAWGMNGQPLLPQHGSPLRLIVPGWYGMTNVKWLTTVEAINNKFDGYQMQAYTYRQSAADPPERMRHLKVRSLMVPPGIPDFFTRRRLVEAGTDVAITGRAWAGPLQIAKVEVSVDGGQIWEQAQLREAVGRFAWRGWDYVWKNVTPGEHVLQCRAFDEEGNEQEEDDVFNYYGMGFTAPQKVLVVGLHKQEMAITGKRLANPPKHPRL